MKRHPSKRLIQLLLLTKEDVKSYLDKYELPMVEKNYIRSLEDELDIEIPDEDVENFKTVGDVVNYVKAHHEE